MHLPKLPVQYKIKEMNDARTYSSNNSNDVFLYNSHGNGNNDRQNNKKKEGAKCQ